MGGAGIRSLDIGGALAESISRAVGGAITKLSNDIVSVMEPLKSVFAEITKTIGVLAQGLGGLAEGFASIQVEKFKALINVLAALTPVITGVAASFSEVLKLYGRVLEIPIVQYFAQIGVTMKVVEAVGVKMVVQLGLLAGVLIAKWKPVVVFFTALGAKIGGILALIATGVGAIFTQVGSVIASFAAVIVNSVPASEALAASLQKLAAQMGAVGVNATNAGAKVGTMAGAMAAAATAIRGMIWKMIRLNLIIFAVVGLISIAIDAFGRFKRAQEDQARARNAEKALERLTDGTYDVKKGLDAATRAKKEFDEAMVKAQQDKVKEQLNETIKKINELGRAVKTPISTWFRQTWHSKGWCRSPSSGHTHETSQA